MTVVVMAIINDNGNPSYRIVNAYPAAKVHSKAKQSHQTTSKSLVFCHRSHIVFVAVEEDRQKPKVKALN